MMIAIRGRDRNDRRPGIDLPRLPCHHRDHGQGAGRAALDESGVAAERRNLRFDGAVILDGPQLFAPSSGRRQGKLDARIGIFLPAPDPRRSQWSAPPTNSRIAATAVAARAIRPSGRSGGPIG